MEYVIAIVVILILIRGIFAVRNGELKDDNWDGSGNRKKNYGWKFRDR